MSTCSYAERRHRRTKKRRDSRARDAELFGDVLVAKSCGDEFQHLPFSASQPTVNGYRGPASYAHYRLRICCRVKQTARIRQSAFGRPKRQIKAPRGLRDRKSRTDQVEKTLLLIAQPTIGFFFHAATIERGAQQTLNATLKGASAADLRLADVAY